MALFVEEAIIIYQMGKCAMNMKRERERERKREREREREYSGQFE